MCLQKKPLQRPNCEELLQHVHFQPLSDENTRNEYKCRIKAEICDQIDNVGRSSKTLEEGGYVSNRLFFVYLVSFSL